MDCYYCEDEEPGINGAIMPKHEGSMVVRNTITVDEFDDYVKKIVLEGGKMLTEKMDIPGIGEWASFEDTEGNVSGILKPSMESMQRYQEMHKK